jgi:hypothetical protein
MENKIVISAKQSLGYCCVLATMEFRFVLSLFGVAWLAVMRHMTLCFYLWVNYFYTALNNAALCPSD